MKNVNEYPSISESNILTDSELSETLGGACNSSCKPGCGDSCKPGAKTTTTKVEKEAETTILK